MHKDAVLQLRYLGVIPQAGHREYGFRIENKDKSTRQVVLVIDDALFQKHHLKFQEAPDLCYQKVLGNLTNETENIPLLNRVLVTASDVANYRISHPNAKSRNSP